VPVAGQILNVVDVHAGIEQRGGGGSAQRARVQARRSTSESASRYLPI